MTWCSACSKAGERRRPRPSPPISAPFETIEAVDPYTVRIVLQENVPSLLGIVTNYARRLHRLAAARWSSAATTSTARRSAPAPSRSERVTPNQSAGARRARQLFPRRAEDREDQLPLHPVRRLARPRLPERRARPELRPRRPDLGQPHAAGAGHHRRRVRAGRAGDPQPQHHQPPFNDIRVRQAIAYAVNRPELVRWRGAGRQPRGRRAVVPRGYLGFTADHGAAAARCREGAGAADGGRLSRTASRSRVIHTQLPEMLTAMQVVQAQLRRAGITLDLQVVEHATFHQQIRQDLSPIVYYSAARFPVADVYLTQFFHSRSIVGTPTAVTNFSPLQRGATRRSTRRAVEHRHGEQLRALGGGAEEAGGEGLRRAGVRDAAGLRAARHPRLRLRAEGLA